MGALIIIPAVTSKRIARKLSEMLSLSIILAVLATLLGMGIASSLQQETGPIIVLVAAGGFAISLLKRVPSV
jgi:ABC-type Mn2+/Zn2+ transport system permease subunit